MKRIILVIVLAGLVASAQAATEVQVIWDRTFGEKGISEWANAVAVMPDGGIVVAGEAYTNNTDLWVRRLDREGHLIWTRMFGGAGDDDANSIAVLPDGSIVVAGSTDSKGAGASDGWIIRLSAGGDMLWDRTFGGEWGEVFNAIAATADGGIIVGGVKPGPAAPAAWVLRLDAEGKIVWDRTINDPGNKSVWDPRNKYLWANGVATQPDGKPVVLISKASPRAAKREVFVLTLDAISGQTEREFDSTYYFGLASIPDI